jgi:hypothetical protein
LLLIPIVDLHGEKRPRLVVRLGHARDEAAVPDGVVLDEEQADDALAEHV